MKKYALTALLLITGTSNAALITSSTDPVLTGSSLVNFDGTLTQSAPSLTFGDITFSTTGGTLRIEPFGVGGSGWMGSGQTLTTRLTSSPSSFSIDFSTTVSAFGMNWGAANPNWNVDLFDTSNTLLESIVFVGGNGGATFSEFYGASNSGIARAVFASTSGFDWIIIDDFQYVTDMTNGSVTVPEPMSVALLGVGLAGIGFSRKKKTA